jgi:hypothetical protein
MGHNSEYLRGSARHPDRQRHAEAQTKLSAVYIKPGDTASLV